MKYIEKVLNCLADKDAKITNFDLEDVIYKKVNDIEVKVSGLNEHKKFDGMIYFWKGSNIVMRMQCKHIGHIKDAMNNTNKIVELKNVLKQSDEFLKTLGLK